MSHTNSISWPNMFNISSNKVNLVTDSTAVTNRTKLLILTEPTELYMNPDFGVGLRRHLWQYNTKNQKAIIQNRIIDQLRKHEPSVDPEKTECEDGLLFTGDDSSNAQDNSKLNLTLGLKLKFGEIVTININDDQYQNYVNQILS